MATVKSDSSQGTPKTIFPTVVQKTRKKQKPMKITLASKHQNSSFSKNCSPKTIQMFYHLLNTVCVK